MRRERKPLRERDALFWLIAARLMLSLLPFRRVADRLGEPGREASRTLAERDEEHAIRIRNIIVHACRRVRWNPSCLVRSMAAMILLRRAGLEGTLYLGVARTPGELHAHAWVRCGEIIVAGGRGHTRYQVLNSFARAR
jgi:hypothetical protein